jgi:hypothetical protein
MTDQGKARPETNPELEAAIADDPDLSAPFRSYGEWLRARGDARGEFVFLQAEIEAEEKRIESEAFAKYDATWIVDLARDMDVHPAMFLAHASVPTALDEERKPGTAKFQKLEKRAKKIFDTHRKKWLGAAANRVHYDRWRFGFLWDATLIEKDSWDLVDAYTILRSVPAARVVEQLQLCGPGYPEILRALAADPPYAVRKLKFGNSDETAPAHFGSLFTTLPRLKALSICIPPGGMFFGATRFPELRTLDLSGVYGLKKDTLAEIASASFPQLRSLTVDFAPPGRGKYDKDEGDYSLGDILRLADPARMPCLVHLALCASTFADQLPEALLRSPILPQLRALDIRGKSADLRLTREVNLLPPPVADVFKEWLSPMQEADDRPSRTMSDAAGRTILDNAKAFEHLLYLNVSENTLSSEVQSRLKGICRIVNAWEGPRIG